MSIELRIKCFQDLSSNNWFPRFNYVLYEYMLYVHKKERIRKDCLSDISSFYY